MADDELKAGFTGTPTEKVNGVTGKVLEAASAVRQEGSSVVAGVADHPHTASTILLGITAIAFGLGFLMGRNSADSETSRYWR